MVHSISYGAGESAIGRHDMVTWDTEAIKLGVRGVTIVVASGDDGVGSTDAADNILRCGYNPGEFY
jgi:subtilase family serine protease